MKIKFMPLGWKGLRRRGRSIDNYTFGHDFISLQPIPPIGIEVLFDRTLILE
jgi:hypothetical protein